MTKHTHLQTEHTLTPNPNCTNTRKEMYPELKFDGFTDAATRLRGLQRDKQQQLMELRKGEQRLKSQEDSFDRFKEKELNKLKERDAKMTEVEVSMQREREKHEQEKRDIMEMKGMGRTSFLNMFKHLITSMK